MQLGGVVHLVEPVDDGLVVGRNVVHHLGVHHHLLEREAPEVGHDVGADPVEQVGCCLGAGEVDPHEPTPLLCCRGGRTKTVDEFGVEVLAFGNAHHLAGGVVHPAVPWAHQATVAARRFATGEACPAVLAHVVECGDGTVGLPGDDHGFAVAFVQHPVARVGDFGGMGTEQPRTAQGCDTFTFIANGVAVEIGIDGRTTTRRVDELFTESRRCVTACRSIHHGCSLVRRGWVNSARNDGARVTRTRAPSLLHVFSRCDWLTDQTPQSVLN